MPNGLTLTVLACNHFVEREDRDDESLYHTLIGIYNALDSKWSCEMPATPFDDLLERYDQTFKENFMHALSSLINDAKAALAEDSKYKASKLWKNHLGTRFPLAPSEQKAGSKAALGALIGNNKPYYDGGKYV